MIREPMVRVRPWLLVGCLMATLVPARAATFTVDSTADEVDAAPGDGVCASAANHCTLRAAVMEANALPGGDAIVLPAGTFHLSLVGDGEDAALTGDLDVTDSVEITGAGADTTAIDGYGADRIFDVIGGALSLTNLTLRRGSPSGGNGGAIQHAGPGALTLTSVRLERNFANTGAAVYDSGGPLAVTGCTFSENVAGYSGGGIYKTDAGSLTVSASVFAGNVGGGGSGGAVAFDGAEGVAIDGSQFTSNSGGSGGAVWVNQAASLAISNTQFTDSQSYGNGGGVSYQGPGPTTIANSTFTDGIAGGAGGALFVDADGGLDIGGSTFTDNAAGYAGGALYYNSTDGGLTLHDGALTTNAAFGGSGGAFYVTAGGPLALANLEVSGNTSAGGGGGGLAFYHSMATIASVRFVGNVTADQAGGGLYEYAQGDTTLADSTFWGNGVDDGDGGGLYLTGSGALDIERSLFAANQAGGTDAQGGGLFVGTGDQSVIRNVTFSANGSAYRGGGLYAASDVLLRSATFANNASPEGASLYNNAQLIIANTILAGPAGANCAGSALSSGNRNIDTDGTCQLDGPSDRSGIDPQLGPLADNGGPTATHALAITSPAIDTGNNAVCPETDQRGIPRPADGDGDGTATCDIGAFEYFDQCPNDPAKTMPGVCGCGVADTDDNGNGVVDCLLNAEVKARIAQARAMLGALTTEGGAEQRARRRDLKTMAGNLVAYVTQHRQGLVLTDPGTDPAKLATRAGRALKATARAPKARLDRMRQRAMAALDRLDQLVVQQ